ncbi:hypothetical protein BC939DRAFT_528621 [Gamsiella multidivaricata]|uniref:uncharacterized protein n=1 Tax=Gamsiella multidivaricata TaxID=101098 RepID=UPI00221FEDC3|nr:uncharacterized protein BC939DRAFT_528621 [Gamsiella multidivaricata]KAI7824037.1 hypothetical protein BC939DRAFT_528621 [Gamsiella multidivaricata]
MGRVTGRSFAKGLAVLHGSGSDDKQGVLDQYCSQIAVSSEILELPKQVFFHKAETSEEASKSSDPIDEKMETVDSIIIFLQENMVNSNFTAVMMNTGPIDRRLQRGLQQNYGTGDYLEASQHIESIIQDLVKLYMGWIRYGSLAIFNCYTTLESFKAMLGNKDAMPFDLIYFVFARINIWSPEGTVTQEGAALLSTIDDHGEFSVHNLVSVFWIFDIVLPSSNRPMYLPMPAYEDNFCLSSKNQLIEP